MLCITLSLPVLSLPTEQQTTDSQTEQPPKTDNETFAPSADGDESTESLTSFSETLADDTRYYPDSEDYESICTTSGNWLALDGSTNDTWIVSARSGYQDAEIVSDSDLLIAWAWDSYEAGAQENVHYASHLATEVILANQKLWAYIRLDENELRFRFFYCNNSGGVPADHDYGDWYQPGDTDWHEYCDDPGSELSGNITFVGIQLQWNGAIRFAETNDTLWCDWLQFSEFVPCDFSDSSYTESFTDIGDWFWYAGEAEDEISTNGDAMAAEFANDGSGNSDYLYTYSPSFTEVGTYYIMARYRMNTTTGPSVSMYARSIDATGGGTLTSLGSYTRTTDWTTSRWVVTTTVAMEAFYFYTSFTTHSDFIFYVDWLRIWDGGILESGWAHDGSTTHNITILAGGSVSTDGDYLSLVSDADSATFDFFIDPTESTGSLRGMLGSLFPFMEIGINSGDIGDDIMIQVQTSSEAWGTIQSKTTITSSTMRFNHVVPTSGGYIGKFRIWAYSSQTLRIDYMKIYTIANWTISQSQCEVADYLYVSSSALYCSALTSDANEYIRLDYDPTISITQATYQVFNVTTDATDNHAEFYFTMYNGAWGTATDNTRGPTATGTITDIRLQFQGDTSAAATRYISAVKFIIDATAPVILDRFATPANPNPDDSVTISVIVSEAIEVYEVTLNAVAYPAGFSDVDYICSEEVANTAFNYTFSDLDEGYYLFEITANDGANEDIEYLPVTITAKTFIISDVVLITSTETLASISGYSTLDAAYTIYENDTNSGSGSISAGWFSIAWTKDDTAGAYVELGLKFVAGGVTHWVNGSYSVASAVVLQVTDTLHTESDTTNYLSGYANLGCTWTAYDNNSLIDSGSLGAGSFAIRWDKQTTEGLHEWGIKFISGAITRWVNGTYAADGIVIENAWAGQDNDTVYISGELFSSITTLTYTVYEDAGLGNVLRSSGSITLTSTRAWFSIEWAKSAENVEANFTLVISDGTNNSTIYGFYTERAAEVTNITNASSYFREGDNVSTINNTTIQTDTASIEFVLAIVGLTTAAIFLGGVIEWWFGRGRSDREYHLAVASGRNNG